MTEHQEFLFGDIAGNLPWQDLWAGMPEFVSDDVKPDSTMTVQFETAEDRHQFMDLLKYKRDRVKSIWFPRQDYLSQSDRDAPGVSVEPNTYPIYVISKGRWEKPLTVNALKRLGLDFRLVIEPQEFPRYAETVGPDNILVLPFSNLGEGSIPARNWVWEHAIRAGTGRHWILDDNLDGFYRMNRNLKWRIVDENPFSACEVFCDRWDNVALAGLQYEFFADRRSPHPPYILNTRIYSCILIDNKLTHRWRGRYNEDTDLAIRALKDGLCTVLLNAYLCKKMPTMTMTGGNTEDLYEIEDGRRKMAQSLVDQHPDVTTITHKWGRWQHLVDYSRFKHNTLQPTSPK